MRGQLCVRARRRAPASAASPISINPSRAPPPPLIEGVTFKVTVLADEVPSAFEQVKE
jgi:hypothetical protein